MSSNVYSKNDILQSLAQEGFFVDFLTLDSFIAKFKLEAIFEDENGVEFFDASAYNTLLDNVLNRQTSSAQQPQVTQPAFEQEPVQYQPQTQVAPQPFVEPKPVEAVGSDVANILGKINLSDGTNVLDNIVPSSKPQNNQTMEALGDIKWHEWQEVSADLVKPEENPQEGVDINLNEQINLDDSLNIENQAQTQEDYWNTPQEDFSQPQYNSLSDDSKNEIQQVMTQDVSEDDFDDIGLLSDSIQAQEKFQNYIVQELAKKNVDLTPKVENAFKLDVSEKTLNMVARAIAKKIARQVSSIFSADQQNNAQVAQIQEKNKSLQNRLNLLEEENKKLKLLLVESNRNLSSYKPTVFGFYKYVKKKPGKK